MENNKKAAEGREESQKKKGTQNEQIMKTNCLRCVFEWLARALAQSFVECVAATRAILRASEVFHRELLILSVGEWAIICVRVADGPQATFAPNTP